MRSVTLKSAITPSFMGRMATMFPGVRPSMSFASFPIASTSLVTLLIATMEGSFTTTPLPFAYTSVFAVPRSMARSEEKRLNNERSFISRGLAAQRRAASSFHQTNLPPAFIVRLLPRNRVDEDIIARTRGQDFVLFQGVTSADGGLRKERACYQDNLPRDDDAPG